MCAGVKSREAWKLMGAGQIASAILLASVSWSGVSMAASPAPEVVARFDQAKGETPEDVAVDLLGNRYVSLALSGEIRKIAPNGQQSTYAKLPIGTPLAFCSGFYSLSGPMVFDAFGNLFVSVGGCNPVNRGVYKIPQGGGAPVLVVKLPDDSFPNGNLLSGGRLYVADSNLATIWEIDPYRTAARGNEAKAWLQSPLLARRQAGAGFPGANGLQQYGRSFYVAATDTSRIIEIPVLLNGKPGEPRVYADTPYGCDDFAFDLQGNLYCASFFDVVLKVDRSGQSSVVLSGDALDGPTSIAFGRTYSDFLDIYITNGSFPGFSAKNSPSLVRYRVGAAGVPQLSP